MNIDDIEVGIVTYYISGDMENGYMGGKPYICHESINRKIKRITDTHIICECDRKFIRNDSLLIVQI